MKAELLPPSILKCVAPEDRKALGLGLTPEEALAKAQIRNERELQKQIIALLRLKGIEPIVSRMDKRTSNNLGLPDILFGAATYEPAFDHAGEPYDMCSQIPCAWEVKFGKGQLSREQQQMHIRLSTPPNCWRIRVIRSVDEAIAELKEIGIT